MKLLAVAAAALALVASVACTAAGPEDEAEGESQETSALGAKTIERAVVARMYVEGKRTVDLPAGTVDDYANRIADDLARLKPTFVSGLIRKNKPLAAGEAALSPDEIRAFQIVKKRLPGAKLDVTLTTENPDGKLKKDELLAIMKSVDDAVHPDGWFFDFFTSAGDGVMEAAIAFAHKRHEIVGGNYFASPANPNGTEKADYFSVPDNECGELDTDKIEKLRAKFNKPILTHINNNAQNDDTTVCNGKKGTLSCSYIDDWSHDKRETYLDKRASGQKAGHYTYMYNAFFPACPIGQYYDAASDKAPGSNKTMLDAMVQAAGKFN